MPVQLLTAIKVVLVFRISQPDNASEILCEIFIAPKVKPCSKVGVPRAPQQVLLTMLLTICASAYYPHSAPPSSCMARVVMINQYYKLL